MIDLIYSISQTINGLYPDDPIYIEDVEQNFIPGTFFIRFVSSQDTGRLHKRKYRTYSYDVMYYPHEGNTQKAECIDVGEALRDALEVITYGEKTIKTVERDITIVDNVLHVMIGVELFVDEIKIVPTMEGITIDVDME